jgi:hypothetical protein
MEIKDSGSRQAFASWAVRDNQTGKGRFDLLPFRAIWGVSKIFEGGALKYSPNNWRKGIPLARFVDSGMRHLAKWMMGWKDEPHLEMAVWNFMCLLETKGMIEEGLLPEKLNNLPYLELKVMANPYGIPEMKTDETS